MSTTKLFTIIGASAALLAVGLGAFGAHGLKRSISEQMLAVYQTGVQYHMTHALGLILIAALANRFDSTLLTWAGWIMLVGIVLFSGSLYGLSLSGARWLGPITPLGGLAFILAWALVVVAAWRHIE